MQRETPAPGGVLQLAPKQIHKSIHSSKICPPKINKTMNSILSVTMCVAMKSKVYSALKLIACFLFQIHVRY